MNIRPATASDRAEWLRMRRQLWPESPGDHAHELNRYFEVAGNEIATFVAECEPGRVCGFVEASTRAYAEGCTSSPVGYVEGWWVDPGYRGKGVGASLMAAAEAWARSLGMTEMASDTELENGPSIDAHRALGYREVERIVCFRKPLQ